MNVSLVSPTVSDTTKKVPLARKNAHAGPNCGYTAMRPRCLGGAYSAVNRVAPAHSPPNAKPCRKRIATSNTGPQNPMPFSKRPKAPES